MRVAHQCLLSLAANSVYLPYAYMVKAGLFKKTWDSMLVWLACALVDAITVSLVTVIAYGGATGVNGISVLTAALVVAMKNIVVSVVSSSMGRILSTSAKKNWTTLMRMMIPLKIRLNRP